MRTTEKLPSKPDPRSGKTSTRGTTARNFITLIAIILMATFAGAQTPIAASTQFDITGFIQSATLGGPGSGAHQGGSITVNGHVVTIPAETMVILPANALTWQELFAQAPAPYTGTATGMALNDSPKPFTTYEAQIVGNRVNDVYIAGLVWISQHALNTGAGFHQFHQLRKRRNSCRRCDGQQHHWNPRTAERSVECRSRHRALRPSHDAGPALHGRPGQSDGQKRIRLPHVHTARSGGSNIAGNPDDALCPQNQRPAAIALRRALLPSS